MAHDNFAIDGTAIRRARICAGFSGAQLARHVGVTGPYLSTVERGHKKASPSLLKRIADATGKKVEDFVSFDAAEAA
jgi:transcriptional regulator with XRE-family HTH domain